VQLNEPNEDASLAGSSSTDMPNLVGPVHLLNPHNSSSHLVFDPSAFAQNTCNSPTDPGCGTFGTANRRFFHGPGINNFDMGLTKRIPITEARAFELRGEFFNIFNHAQFLNPSGDIDGNFGVVTNARDPRIGQLSAKFAW